jgi:PAS domain S-box-containing protein
MILWVIFIIGEGNNIREDRDQILAKLQVIDDLFQNSPVGFHSLDENGYFLKLNRMAESWLGYESWELAGKKKFPELLSPESQKQFQVEFEQFKKNGNVNNLRFELIRKDGTSLFILLSATAIYDEEGKMHMTRSTYVYHTETVNFEKELITAKRKAEEANNAKTDFLSSMSHELRTPLNAVIGITHLLIEENPDPEQIENLNNLKFSSETLLALINDILDFNKIENQKIILEQIPFRIDTLVQAVIYSSEY